ncbi:MAG: GAF domain-containing protein [Anaerolineae bacterium]|nr:MAG: GAF domain-containing protein [Anaerolineae bacterium]
MNGGNAVSHCTPRVLMNPPNPPISHKPGSRAPARGRLWARLIAPAPDITEADERRQATLLTAFLLGTIIIAFLMEAITVAFSDWQEYSGWRVTLGVIVILALLYRLSRTRHTRTAALLSVLLISAAVFAAGIVEPRGILGGLLSFIILPLWLGSLYLTLPQLLALVALNMIVMLALPLFVPVVSLEDILIGPVSFLLGTSILLVVITLHRDRLEEDRRSQLVEKEVASQREAARARALLRVSERLNAQMGFEGLFEVICDEIVLALNTPAATLALYDPKTDRLATVALKGLPPEARARIPEYPRALYEETIGRLGESFAVSDIPERVRGIDLQPYRELACRSIAVATIRYNGELIGYLNAITRVERREFSEDELLLLRGIADQAALAIINTRLYKEARNRLENLQALRAIDVAITANHELAEMLGIALAQVIDRLAVDAAAILVLNPRNQRLEFATSRGFSTESLKHTSLKIGEGMAGKAALEKRILYVPNVAEDPQSLTKAPVLQREGFVSYFAAPLIVQDQVRGVLEIFHRSHLEPHQEWLDFLEALSGQMAIAIENATLFADLENRNMELSQAYDSTIEGWSLALDLRDRETEGHTQRVTELTLALARSFGLDDASLVQMRRGALLHDIGKMGIPDTILHKPGPLTEEEWVVMRRHPDLAHDMLSSIDYLRPALEIPLTHHEKWDGSGYPRGLKGEEIPLSARIFAAADVWDALTSDRPYRRAVTREDALRYFREETGKHFDPQVVAHFLTLIQQRLD